MTAQQAADMLLYIAGSLLFFQALQVAFGQDNHERRIELRRIELLILVAIVLLFSVAIRARADSDSIHAWLSAIWRGQP